MKKPELKIFEDTKELFENIARELEKEINTAAFNKKIFNLAISGGSTPTPLFQLLAGNDYDILSNYLHVYWVDERCVPVGDPESNFGTAYKLWLKKIPLPSLNIHRIIGEANPEMEAKRYEEDVKANLSVNREGIPVFDFIILGIGYDGHTASIFPGFTDNLNSNSLTIVTEHPLTGQKRISLTTKAINNGLKVLFIVTGKEKTKIVADIFTNSEIKKAYPAGHINPVNGKLSWYLDKEAASGLNRGKHI